jgi:5-methylcytosine-specific restriction endonuclease McrA
MSSTMILNASYEPLSIVSVKRAIGLLLSGKAVALDESGLIFRHRNGELSIPYVIKLVYYVQRKPDSKPAKFSKATVLARDNNTCGYCGKRADTVDHIIPKKLGGDNSYENCVAACLRCNSKKADKHIKEVGYELLIKPYIPSRYSNILSRVQGNQEVYSAWSKYVFMYQPQLQEVFNVRITSREFEIISNG